MRNEPYPLYEVDPVSDLKELVSHCAEKYDDKPAFIFERDKETVSISYRQFKSDVDALGTAFFDMGIQNVKVAVIGENSYEWILTYFAVVNSGNVIVPLDKELPASEVKTLVDHSDAKVFVYADTYADMAKQVRENNAAIRHFISMGDLRRLIEKGASLVQGGDNSVVNYQINNNVLAAVLYTSGTTGTPKGVMLSHKNLARNTVACRQSVKIRDSNLLVLPLHHSFGFTTCVLFVLFSGCKVVINKSLKRIMEDFTEYKPNSVFLVPLFVETFYKKIWDNAKKARKDGLLKKLIGVSNVLLKIGIDVRRKLFKSVLQAFGGNLELIVTGGAPIDAKYVQGLQNFGISTLNGYGITECSPVVSVNRIHHYKDGSIGQVLPCCVVKIAEPDENGHGEIYVKGDIVMLGYYKNGQATAEAFDGEWYKTGDIGYMDGDGFLFITGRKKNLIVLSNGKNVYPEEIEFALLKHIPYVREVVVYAGDNEIVAEVFLDTDNDPGCASRLEGDVVALNRTLPPYKNIGRTVIRGTEFPKTTTKKIKRQYK